MLYKVDEEQFQKRFEHIVVKCANPFKVQERPLRTCTRAAQCSKISMNCMAQLLLTAFFLIQVNFLGFILFLLFDLKVQSEYKVEKVQEDSLDLIPSPSTSMKIQIIGMKIYSR